jgi:hypothetical protein
MGLISNCDNSACWQRRQCYRYMQQAGNRPGDVCTRLDIPTPAEGEPCDCCVVLMPGDRLRLDTP